MSADQVVRRGLQRFEGDPPELRAQHLAAVWGARGRLYRRRQRLLGETTPCRRPSSGEVAADRCKRSGVETRIIGLYPLLDEIAEERPILLDSLRRVVQLQYSSLPECDVSTDLSAILSATGLELFGGSEREFFRR